MSSETQTAVLQVVSLIVTTGGAVLLAWIALKQATLSRVVKELEKNTNSLTEALVKSTAESSLAKGKQEGIAEQKAVESVAKENIAAGKAEAEANPKNS